MKKIISLTEYIRMGGKIENLDVVFNKYHQEKGKITFSHKNPPSFGNPNGVDMYNVGNKKVADDWIEMEIELILHPQYTNKR